MRDDYDLWRMWWYAEHYGASAELRMRIMDQRRAQKGRSFVAH